MPVVRDFAKALLRGERWALLIKEFIETTDLSMLNEDWFNPDCNMSIYVDECTDEKKHIAMQQKFCPSYLHRGVE